MNKETLGISKLSVYKVYSSITKYANSTGWQTYNGIIEESDVYKDLKAKIPDQCREKAQKSPTQRCGLGAVAPTGASKICSISRSCGFLGGS